jgi:cytochrome P450
MISLRTATAKTARMGAAAAASTGGRGIPSTIAKGVSVRFKSAISTDDGASQSKCPFTGATKQPPNLVEVPALPLLGSRVAQYSGTPPFSPEQMYEHAQGMYQKFGEFFSHGVPGFGQGIFGKVYAITDPNEMLKVVRSEGALPTGGIQLMWPLVKLFKHYNSPVVNIHTGDMGMLGQGEGWKAQRTFFQAGMLDPRAARMYIPGISAAAELASKGAPDAAKRNDLNYYLNLCAFDMFCAFMFGELTQCADRSRHDSNGKAAEEMKENIVFCEDAITCMEQMMQMAISPKEILADKVGIDTALFKDFAARWAKVRVIGLKKLTAFANKYEAGDLNEHERNSYFAHAMDRLKDHPDISHEQMMEMAFMALFAGVDTTR